MFCDVLYYNTKYMRERIYFFQEKGGGNLFFYSVYGIEGVMQEMRHPLLFLL